jgi:uncharacterized protein with FMN-binding domain
MKRALLIAGGTVGGLGAVLSITPPQLSSHGLATIAGASADTSIPAATQSSAAVTTTTSATPTAAAVATKKATATPTKSATTKKSTTSSSTSSSSSSSSASSNSSTTSATPTPAATKATSTASGSFTGEAFNVGYGMVQVKITVSNGKITDAVAVQAPSGRNQRFTDYAVPNLRQQTLSAQSAAISGVSGASYTSYGWYKSLISALQKAGMTTGV